MPFQTTVPIYNTPGMPGDLAYTGPIRSTIYNLNSANSTPSNTVGNVFTITNGGNPDPLGAAPNAGVARVGGTGKFAGILVNSKEYALYATSGIPLNPTLNLPDNTVGSLMTMGEVWVNVENQPSVGDLAYYDSTDGSISTMPATTTFVGSSSTTTLTVASISSGTIRVGMLIGTRDNPGVTPGTYITALGTGLGGVGTYTISISQSIAGSTTISVPNQVPVAFSGTATSSGTTLTVASVVSGQVYIGMPVVGTGFAAGTVVTAFGTGVGGTGTYTTNQANTVSPAAAITATAGVLIPNAVISRYDITFPGLACLKLTN